MNLRKDCFQYCANIDPFDLKGHPLLLPTLEFSFRASNRIILRGDFKYKPWILVYASCYLYQLPESGGNVSQDFSYIHRVSWVGAKALLPNTIVLKVHKLSEPTISNVLLGVE